MKWTKNIIIKEIKNLDYKNASFVRKNRCSLLSAAQKYFGSWKKAVIAAGIDYSTIKINNDWTRDIIVKEILKIKNLQYTSILEENSSLYAAAIRYFGSWKKAVESSGIAYNKVEYRKKYSVDDNFFSIDTPESFYWAGFIAADGCIFKNSLSIGLSSKDREHLVKFVKCVKFTGKIYDSIQHKRFKNSAIRINSIKTCSDLKRFNIVPRKSLVYVFPSWMIEHKLVNHFMRGYSDGDGCWSLQKAKRKGWTNTLCFNVLGTEKFLNTFVYVLNKNCKIKNPKVRKTKSNVSSISYGGNIQVANIRDFLYRNSNNDIFLDRKMKKAYNISVKIDTTKAVIGEDIVTGEKLYLSSIAEGKKYGFQSSNITKCCKKSRKSHKGYKWCYVAN